MRDQKTARGGAIPKQTQTRIPVTQRLGPSSPLAPQVEVVNEQLRIPAKKRLGRPSTKKPLGVNTAGTRTSTKRRVAPVRTSPIRKQSWKAVHTGLCLPPTGVNAGSLAAWILWTLWISRNYRIFQGKIFSSQEVVTKAIIDAKEWNTAQVKNIPPETAKRGPRMETRFDIICQSDAAWKKESSTAGTAWKFSGSDEDRSRSNTKIFTLVKSPLVAEGLALRSAMEQAILLDYKQISFETDSKILVTAILEGSHISDLHGILSDIKTLATAFTSISFHWIARNSVSAVDMLAKQALNAFVSNLV
ncbi:hypothetical protein IGI04_001358 [Brassica rapa subsp. trilocularis]|uniref:RNase H type-1 domain-containing protein n=1 Tax=Brassica rapa subsp. trilocularis TaxID=1813537 RepID=A0ABQ7NSF4_BRACM|nr:hypothetical protein IGI04_001358 [Brassica rapa subsp. trilocularis]